MEFTAIEHSAGDVRRPLTLDQIRAVCARAFGGEREITSARELDGGEFNTIYRIQPADQDAVILRVAPPPARHLPWHEEWLMRREHAIQPYFAPLAPLLPRTLMVDFTHQILDRDYLFQTRMPGTSWSAVADGLTAEEERSLWRQLAHIAKTIASVRGETFGDPSPGRQFPAWSLTIIDWLERVVREAARAQLDTTEVRAILAAAKAHPDLLDEIREPRLLHGDLWTFNVLIERAVEGGPRIVAVLDADRACWGDPLADWMFHLLPRRASPEARAAFWEEYGEDACAPDRSLGARFRDAIYEGKHAGVVLADVARRGREDQLPKVYATLRNVVADLQALGE